MIARPLHNIRWPCNNCRNSPHLRKLRKCLYKDVWSVRPSALVRLADQGTFTFNGIISERESNKQNHRVTHLINHNGKCSAANWRNTGLEKASLNFMTDKNLGFMTDKKTEIRWTWGFGYLRQPVALGKTYWEMFKVW